MKATRRKEEKDTKIIPLAPIAAMSQPILARVGPEKRPEGFAFRLHLLDFCLHANASRSMDFYCRPITLLLHHDPVLIPCIQWTGGAI